MGRLYLKNIEVFYFFCRHSEFGASRMVSVQLFGFRVYSQFADAQAVLGEFRIYKGWGIGIGIGIGVGMMRGSGALKYLNTTLHTQQFVLWSLLILCLCHGEGIGRFCTLSFNVFDLARTPAENHDPDGHYPHRLRTMPDVDRCGA